MIIKPKRERMLRLVAAIGWATVAAAAITGQAFAAPPQDNATPGKQSMLQAVIVGGGPDFEHNQTAIESNVRFVSRLLPPGTRSRVLFADGSLVTKDVQCLTSAGEEYYRAPDLPVIDGPNRLLAFQREIETVDKPDNTHPPRPLLLYFTGHGSPDHGGNLDNNQYDMWRRDALTVQKLAGHIASLPSKTPVTVVMAQCYSGAFGNLIFQGADPKAALVDRDLCGFFASIAQRPAAGCTPEVRESYYHDFTGYFFAALSGKDRVGHAVTGADYNQDGIVGMDEAFAYTLYHDMSIDTPVCTSDVFLRRFVTKSDDDIFKTPFAQARTWATPGQKAALDGLSELLKLSSDDRLAKTYAAFQKMNMESNEPHDVYLLRFVRLAKTIVLAHTLSVSGDESVKKRYAALIAAEARNPLVVSGPAAAQPAPDPLATAETAQVTEKFYLPDEQGKPFLHQILRVKVTKPDKVWIQATLQPRWDRTANTLKPSLFVSDGRLIWEYKGATKQYSETSIDLPGDPPDQLTICQFEAMLGLMPLTQFRRDDPNVTRTVTDVTVDGKPMRLTTTRSSGNDSHGELLTDARTGLPYRFISIVKQDGKDRIAFHIDFSEWVLNEAISPTMFVLFPPPGAIEYVPPVTPAIGRRAPDFAAVTPDDKTVRLSDNRGRPVVLAFVAPWNTRSAATLDQLRKIADDKNNLAVLAVISGGRRDEYDHWISEIAKEKYPFPVVYDPSGEDALHSIALSAYNLTAVPTEFVIDKDGKITAIIDDADDGQKLAKAIADLKSGR